ncbi:MAG: OmpH family outer membrane protein [Verrucomicrobiales bacterium]|nr:OmpH family outer membrane protein [Verrucomicrobiales bacterium]
MNVKSSILSVIAAVFTLAASSSVNAQDTKIAVVDMQKALNDYNRTKVEVDKINAFGEEKTKALDGKKAAMKQITDKMVELQKVAADSALEESKRQAAAEQFQALAKERNAKLKEIADDERKASQELLKARQEMEAALVTDIKGVMDQLASSQSVDLIFDKSFLPKANKAIIYTSANVIDLTDQIVGVLNK